MRNLLILGGGTAGWLTAACLARHFDAAMMGPVRITLIESPAIATVGVGEGTFPTLRNTLRTLGIDEAAFMRDTSATFKQGIRFNDWVHTPENGRHEHYFHPFEAPCYAEGAALLPYWLRMDPATRPPFAEAMTFQKRVAEARRGPKRPHEGAFSGPLSYAYHLDAARLNAVLAERARQLGVRHIEDTLTGVVRDENGGIAHIVTEAHGHHTADLYIDCTGFRAELIGKALRAPFHNVRDILFANRAVSCRVPYPRPGAPLESYTVATAHAAGWSWDIGLEQGRGAGYVYSADHCSDEDAETLLRSHIGAGADIETRITRFEPGWRTTPWVGNCVAVGLSGGFVEPLEATGIVLIELAASMIAEMLPAAGPVHAPAARFNMLMNERYENIVHFLKLHYVLSQRNEPFWRDNRDPASLPAGLTERLDQWRYRPPGRFDFRLDTETFAWFNYQYILYGMGFQTDVSGADNGPVSSAEAERMLKRIRQFGERATLDLPPHRTLIEQIYTHGFSEPA
ncbi:tryptophan 7-halogenase [Asticcacaulis sp. EMRT-3]|uniref:tryptophan halogenase family protein n=1 Tax=Asticcacaulis sp. EMRT-3 TaxID=3040349 RepID=UPI0024AEF83C|nr:tryptophan 7-halogenase [Asticcacaulis sp. EMRT-3]MDI7775945.1 tryptophan 7-halogenase [Asticcacaulis sp. EMRT-3]